MIGFGVLSSMFGMFLPYPTHFRTFLLVRFLGAVCNEAADLAAYVLCMEVTGHLLLFLKLFLEFLLDIFKRYIVFLQQCQEVLFG